METTQAAKTVIGEDVEIVGTVRSNGSIEINGKLSGDLSCTGNAVVGGKAQIKGNLNVDSITASGQVNGNITAKDRIELKSTARINGDIRAKRLSVEDGVTLIGKSEVNPSGTVTAKASEDAAEAPKNEGSAKDEVKGGVFKKG
jgi:cytoskeletal protein CcmA (bactofilin family)